MSAELVFVLAVLLLVIVFINFFTDKDLFVKIITKLVDITIGKENESASSERENKDIKDKQDKVEKFSAENLSKVSNRRKYIICRHCENRIKAEKINSHNQKCPKNPRNRTKNSTPF